ncbi:hypothetical protein Tco_1393744 [Tanacetum coccineum]
MNVCSHQFRAIVLHQMTSDYNRSNSEFQTNSNDRQVQSLCFHKSWFPLDIKTATITTRVGITKLPPAESNAEDNRVILFSIHNDEWKSFQCHHQTALRSNGDCTTSSYSLLTLDSTKHNEGQSQALCNCCGEIVSVLFALECLNDFEHTVQASDRQCQMVSLKNNTSGPVLNVKRLLIHYRSALVIMENELLFTSVQASVLHQILLIITAFRTFDSNHNNEQSSSKTGFPKLFLKQTRQLTSRQAFEYKPPSDSNAEATGK